MVFSKGQSQTDTTGYTQSISQGVTEGVTRGHTVGTTHGQTLGYTHGVSVGENEGMSLSMGEGSNFGTSNTVNRGVSLGESLGKVRVIRPEAEHHRGILLLNLILIVSASHRVRVSVTHIILPMGKVQTCPILWETAFRTGMAAVNPLVSAVARHIPKEIYQ